MIGALHFKMGQFFSFSAAMVEEGDGNVEAILQPRFHDECPRFGGGICFFSIAIAGTEARVHDETMRLTLDDRRRCINCPLVIGHDEVAPDSTKPVICYGKAGIKSGNMVCAYQPFLIGT